MAFEVRALLTDEARRRRAEGEATDKHFMVVGFMLGNGGADPLDPTTALAPDPAATDLSGIVFGPKALAGFSYANNSCPIYECIVEQGEGVTLFSSVALIAQITVSPVPNDPELNTTFIYAVANFPQRPKLDTERLELLVGVQR